MAEAIRSAMSTRSGSGKNMLASQIPSRGAVGTASRGSGEVVPSDVVPVTLESRVAAMGGFAGPEGIGGGIPGAPHGDHPSGGRGCAPPPGRTISEPGRPSGRSRALTMANRVLAASGRADMVPPLRGAVAADPTARTPNFEQELEDAIMDSSLPPLPPPPVPPVTDAGGGAVGTAESVVPVSGLAAVGGKPGYRAVPMAGSGAVGTADGSAPVSGIAAVGGDTWYGAQRSFNRPPGFPPTSVKSMVVQNGDRQNLVAQSLIDRFNAHAASTATSAIDQDLQKWMRMASAVNAAEHRAESATITAAEEIVAARASNQHAEHLSASLAAAATETQGMHSALASAAHRLTGTEAAAEAALQSTQLQAAQHISTLEAAANDAHDRHIAGLRSEMVKELRENEEEMAKMLRMAKHVENQAMTDHATTYGMLQSAEQQIHTANQHLTTSQQEASHYAMIARQGEQVEHMLQSELHDARHALVVCGAVGTANDEVCHELRSKLDKYECELRAQCDATSACASTKHHVEAENARLAAHCESSEHRFREVMAEQSALVNALRSAEVASEANAIEMARTNRVADECRIALRGEAEIASQAVAACRELRDQLAGNAATSSRVPPAAPTGFNPYDCESDSSGMASARREVKIPPWPARLVLNETSPMAADYEQQAQYKIRMYFSHLQREVTTWEERQSLNSESASQSQGAALVPPPPPPLPPATTLAAIANDGARSGGDLVTATLRSELAAQRETQLTLELSAQQSELAAWRAELTEWQDWCDNWNEPEGERRALTDANANSADHKTKPNKNRSRGNGGGDGGDDSSSSSSSGSDDSTNSDDSSDDESDDDSSSDDSDHHARPNSNRDEDDHDDDKRGRKPRKETKGSRDRGDGARSKNGKKHKKAKTDRRVKEADSITLPSWPTIAQLPRWKAQALSNVCQAANRTDERPVREWFMEVETKGMTAKKLKKCPREFRRLDRKLGTALGKLFTGELGRRVDIEEQRLLRDKRELLTGRAKLWYMYDSFRTDSSMARCYTIHDLCSVTFLGDDKLEQLRNVWEDKVANQREGQSSDQLAGILYEVLRHSDKLKEEVAKWRRYPDGHKKKTYDFLVRAWDRQIDFDTRDRNMQHLQTGRRTPAAPGRKKVCKPFLKGTCPHRDQSCDKDHPAGQGGTKRTAAPAEVGGGGVATATGGGGGKGKGKDKGKGKGKKEGLGNRAPINKPCHFHILGKCETVGCRFMHVDNPTPEQKAAAQEYQRSRSSSPAPGRKPCRDHAAGHCAMGDNCNFSHDKPPAAPAPKGKAKAKAKAEAAQKTD